MVLLLVRPSRSRSRCGEILLHGVDAHSLLCGHGRDYSGRHIIAGLPCLQAGAADIQNKNWLVVRHADYYYIYK